MKRLVLIQESGIQLFTGSYETHIHSFIPFDDEEFGKQYCAELNERADLPFYLAWVEVNITSKMEHYNAERLKQEGIKPLKDS